MTAISIHPLNPVIGAEIHGVDLSQSLDPEAKKQIGEAWLAHQVIFFRDQDLTLDQHKAFARDFGDLHVHPNLPGHPDHEEVLVIHADEKSRYVAGQGWHTDVSCEATPPKGSATSSPSTVVASMRRFRRSTGFSVG